jgi:AraC-like DNA-binding protein
MDPAAGQRFLRRTGKRRGVGYDSNMARESDGDVAVLWRPAVEGVEVLHARFRRHEYPRHAHESVTVALMDAGAATFRYRNADFVATKGDVFLLNADAVHTGRPLDEDGYRYRVLYLDALTLSPLLAGDSGRPAGLSFRETVLPDPQIAALLNRTHRALTEPRSGLLAEELLLRLGLLLIGRYGDAPADRPNGARGVVTAALDYLRAHPADQVSLRELAALASVSPYSLVRMFNADIGMPPHSYQTQLRVRLARRLLADGTPAAEAAAQAGFYDQAHLSRVFKRYTGVTPRQFAIGAAHTVSR